MIDSFLVEKFPRRHLMTIPVEKRNPFNVSPGSVVESNVRLRKKIGLVELKETPRESASEFVINATS